MTDQDFETELTALLTELESVRGALATMERRLSGWPALWERFAEQRHAAVWERNAQPKDDTAERVHAAAHRTQRVERRRQATRGAG